MSSYKAVILAIKLAGAGEEHSASGHVDAHGEGLSGEQRLGGGRGKERTKDRLMIRDLNLE